MPARRREWAAAMRVASGGGFAGGGDERPPRDGRQSPQPVSRQQTPRRYARKRHFRYQTVGPRKVEIVVVIVETGPPDKRIKVPLTGVPALIGMSSNGNA